MSKKNVSYTVDSEVVDLLNRWADKECISKSYAVEKILNRFLVVEFGEEIKTSLLDTPYIKPEPYVPAKPTPMTEKERIADWEWRKAKVAAGEFHECMALEYPTRPPGDDPYIKKETKTETDSESDTKIGDAVMKKLIG